MASGNKIYDFSTARKKIYDQWEKKIIFFLQPGKNICPMGLKYMTNGNKIYAFLTAREKMYMSNRNKIYDILTARKKIYVKWE